jgi:hypothetical protein
MAEIQEIPSIDTKEAVAKIGSKALGIAEEVRADIPAYRATLSSASERHTFDEDTGRLVAALANGGTEKGIEVVRSVKQSRRLLSLAA